MKYTVVIRTLGTAGKKYQRMLESLMAQTIRPNEIIVYIADGYTIPNETVGFERYVYVKKGMVSQRALINDDILTEYVLFADDDLYFPPRFVESMYASLINCKGDVISPDVFPNADRPLKNLILMTLSGRMRGRKNDKIWGYKVMRTAGYSYNMDIQNDVYLSQTNAGACFLCKKDTFFNT